jgi:GxxExxY protein
VGLLREPSPESDAAARAVVGAALAIHRGLGPGLLESVYSECLVEQLTSTGTTVETEKRVAIVWNERVLRTPLRLDLLVDGRVIVEVKAVDAIADIHVAQLLTYLRLTGHELGLLLNFNARAMRDGIKRVVNGQPPPPYAPRLEAIVRMTETRKRH